MLADHVVTKALKEDLPILQGRFEIFSDHVLQRLRTLERDRTEARRQRTGFVGLEIRIGIHWPVRRRHDTGTSGDELRSRQDG